MRLLPLALLALLLAACGASEQRFGPAPTTAAPLDNVPVRFARIEVVTVTLPAYAASEEIQVRGADGAITPLGPLWADEPGRGITLQLTSDLGQITGRLVAPEPWPFRDLPDARVDVRIEDFLATEVGTFRLAGQVFVAPENGGRDRARRFEIVVPLAGEPTPATITAARTRAVSDLALFIARQGLR